MSIITEVSNEILQDASPTETTVQQEYRGVIAVIMIISIIVSIMRLIQGCSKTHKEIIEIARNPSVIETLLLKKNVYAALRRHSGAYNKFGRSLTNSILRAGAICSETEIAEILAEVSISNEVSYDIDNVSDIVVNE